MTDLLDLPPELFLHIFSFIYGKKPTINMAITIANLQSISKKINNLSETNEFFNDFWWNTIYDHYFGKSFRAHVLENIRNELVNSNQMKRKIIQALYLKNKVFPKPVSYSLETDIEKYQHDIMVCGKEGSGKNSLILHLIHKQFIQDYGTLADTNYYKIIEVDSVIGMLCIYLNDNVGEIIRKVECFIIVCDVNNSESIDQVREEIKIISQFRESDFNNVPIMFVINKIDLLQDSDSNQIEIARELINQEILKYSLNAGIIEASAKTGENVFLIFEELVRKFPLLDGSTILRNLIEKESEFIQECKTKYTSKTCSLM